LDAIGAEKKIILIAGGVGKGQDFAPLAKEVAKTTRAVILIGEDAPLIRQALRNQGNNALLIEHSETLEQAVQRAADIAQAGEAVLLSPACASFDQFRDYAHRAACFIDAVQNLKAQAGEVL
jgi:UDP-N-acetylmuramoylalanine--D-glutamate ligase